MNLTGIAAIYQQEMARFGRTLLQSIIAPVLSTSLYFTFRDSFRADDGEAVQPTTTPGGEGTP